MFNVFGFLCRVATATGRFFISSLLTFLSWQNSHSYIFNIYCVCLAKWPSVTLTCKVNSGLSQSNICLHCLRASDPSKADIHQWQELRLHLMGHLSMSWISWCRATISFLENPAHETSLPSKSYGEQMHQGFSVGENKDYENCWCNPKTIKAEPCYIPGHHVWCTEFSHVLVEGMLKQICVKTYKSYWCMIYTIQQYII